MYLMKTKKMSEIYNFSFFGFMAEKERREGWLLNDLAYTDLTYTVLDSASTLSPLPPSHSR